MIGRVLILVAIVGLAVSCMSLYKHGGWRWVGSFVLTVAVGMGVAFYAILPSSQGFAVAKVVGLMGGPLLSGAVSLIPASCWFVVSLVHPRGTLGGHVYAVVYAVLVGLCFVPAGLVAAACYFPANARKVLGRLADALPGRSDAS
jgi:hypothetical protein